MVNGDNGTTGHGDSVAPLGSGDVWQELVEAYQLLMSRHHNPFQLLRGHPSITLEWRD